MRKILAFILSIFIIVFVVYIIYSDYTQVEVQSISEEDGFYVLIEDIKLVEESDYMYIDDEIHFSYEFLKEFVDEDLFYDEEESVVVITNQQSVGRFSLEMSLGTMNGKEIQLITPLRNINQNVYVPYNLVKEIYRNELDFNWNNKSLIVDYKGYEYIEGELKEDSQVHLSPHKRSAKIGSTLESGERVVVFAEESSWFRIRTKEGLVGYVHEDNLLIEYGKNRFRIKMEDDQDSTSNISELINLTWDYTYGPMRNIESVQDLPGVNVVAPTWFDVTDTEGTIYDKGSREYSRLYSEKGYQIWPAVTNSFDPELTSELLKSSNTREKLIDDLLNIYQYYQADGINIDFENIYYEDRDNLTQFVRELYPIFSSNGLTVSMDVTPRSTSPNWSMVYDRERLQQSLDYVFLMAYDQHWSASPIAGSVAEYWWVEESVSRLLEQVPADKLVLGMPFYSRVWDVNNDGVSSQAVTMNTALEFIDKNNIETVWDERSQQFYGELKVGDTTRKIWLEDENSLYYKVSLVHKYNLAGMATWRKGFEIPSVWRTLDGYLN
ncbi:glycosyl hydrolase family 18 protein [Gudongella sp. DL1XJH-153]|uniref:glycosyl hydrolase family 18 protein n=1 Tax=Gudongella sp. DL1XJH-153 TaxID=3409804 RepID=UPI003BB48AEB